jgi:hypothetical protein
VPVDCPIAIRFRLTETSHETSAFAFQGNVNPWPTRRGTYSVTVPSSLQQSYLSFFQRMRCQHHVSYDIFA